MRLTVLPSAGSTFGGWIGACAGGVLPCEVTMDGDKTLTGRFTRLQYVLTVQRLGTGTGTVTSSPARIDCGTTCARFFTHGDDVTLTPTPQPGSRFTGWGGACAGEGECKVSMTQAHTVSVTFERIRHTLTVSVDGAGTVTSADGGIDCGTACVSAFDEGTAVSLTAAPQPGHRFAGWSGACASDPCAVTMDTDRSVTARFERVVVRRKLTVLKVTDGSGIKAGRVTATPSGSPALDCGIRCTTQLDEGTEITLKVAEPLPKDSKFAGWTGGCVGAGLSCTFRLGAADTRVNALFVDARPAPVVGVAGTAKPVSGTVLVQRPVPAVPAARALLQAAATEFFPLEGLQTIPVGSIVDATHGTLELTVEDARGRSRKVRAGGGMFRFAQGRRGAAKGKTTLELTGGAFDGCKGSRRVVRRLTVQGAGVRVRGRGSDATSRRAARWVTEDRCDATATKVKQGSVSVRDLKRRKTVTVRGGRSYAARR